MRKGSPRGKIAETSRSEVAQKPQTGEPHEHHSLYRIGRPGAAQPTGGSRGARGLSFLRHADLSPDGHWESNPASASSTLSSYQVFYVPVASDSPAGPRLGYYWARDTVFPMRLSLCFEAGRFTLTQNSWTAVSRCSRKSMYGHAAFALVATRNRVHLAVNTSNALGEPFPRPAGKSPFSLDTLPIMDVIAMYLANFAVKSRLSSISPENVVSVVTFS